MNAVSNGLLNWMWWDDVILWRPAGIFQCLPIFSLAFACQCQLFIVYDSLEEPSIRRIESIVSHAIKFVSVVYMTVSYFHLMLFYTTLLYSTVCHCTSFPQLQHLIFLWETFVVSWEVTCMVEKTILFFKMLRALNKYSDCVATHKGSLEGTLPSFQYSYIQVEIIANLSLSISK